MNSLFENVYQENYKKVVRLCLGYVNGDEALAEDLAQEVFLKVWQHLPSFRNESKISTWIYRITVNTCLLELRKQKFNKSTEEVERVPIESDEEITDTGFQMKQMYHCIHRLSKENQSIILLVLEGVPQREIAEITGISHEAIRVRVHRIKTSLTKCVQNENV
nr:sigma-70 family RNA polymerase sigma factor [Allomuricauda sp.]